MYIAICGAPGAGKSTLQQILLEEFEVQPVDDGRILRDIAIKCFGLTEKQVNTIEGKNSYIEFMGKQWQIRKILGEIGRSLENVFSEHVVPHITVQNYCNNPEKHYSFGSVRRSQPKYFQQIDGLIVEILRPGYESRYDFDDYDRSQIDLTLINDGTQDEFRKLIIQTFGEILSSAQVGGSST